MTTPPPLPTLSQIDAEIDRLLELRKRVVTSELTDSHRSGRMLNGIIRKAAAIHHSDGGDSDAARLYAMHFILPWKIYLNAKHFPATIAALPDAPPDDLGNFLQTLVSKLQQDMEAVEECLVVFGV
jgi:hypothetical protein